MSNSKQYTFEQANKNTLIKAEFTKIVGMFHQYKDNF